MSFAMFCKPSTVAAVCPAGWESVETDIPDIEFAEWVEPSTRTVATVIAPRKELLDRLKTAAKGSGVRLSVNGCVDFSVLYGCRQFGPSPATDHTPASPGGFSAPDFSLELRDPSWIRSGELAEIIPAQRLTSILSKAKGDDNVKLELFRDSETGAHGVIVRTGYAEFTLPTDDGEFPESEPIDTDSVVLVESADLLRAIVQTEYATDVESTRYALGGILVELRADGITLAATDSRRLAKIDVNAQPADGFAPLSGVIPAAAAQLIAAQLKKSTGPVALALSADRFAVESEAWTVAGRLVEGRFPDYRRVIPTQFFGVVKFDRSALLESLETVLIATDEESRGVDFTFHLDCVTLTAKTSSGCAGRVDVPSEFANESGKDETHTITFDPRYIVDYVKRQTAESVCMAIIDHESAAVLESDGGATYVIMPLSRDR